MDTGTLAYLGWALLMAASALTLVVGAILSFHWYRYALNRALATLATIIYFGVSGVLLTIVFISMYV